MTSIETIVTFFHHLVCRQFALFEKLYLRVTCICESNQVRGALYEGDKGTLLHE